MPGADALPLPDHPAVRRELDDRAVAVSVGTGLPLRPDSVLEAGEELPAGHGDVIRLGQRFPVLRRGSSLGIPVMQALPEMTCRT